MLIQGVLIGFASGLLVNYLADVLPANRRLSRPLWWPKECPTSNVQRRRKLIAYLVSGRVLGVFVFFVVVETLIFVFPPLNFPVYLFTCVLIYFTLVTVIDIEHRAVMHPVSIAGAVAMGAIGVWRHGWAPTLIGGAAGFTLMLALYFVGDLLGRGLSRLRGEPWKETALGFGDVNLAAVIGLLMGWPGMLVALVAGIVFAGLYSLAFIQFSMLKGSYKVFAAIPYAPFLCLGTIAMIVVSIY